MNCGTMHGWTDATALQQLATDATALQQLATDATALQQLATNANDNVTRQEVNPGIVLGSVCI